MKLTLLVLIHKFGKEGSRGRDGKHAEDRNGRN